MRKSLNPFKAVVAAAIVVLAIPVGAAAASTGSPQASFAARARSAGLTDTQVVALQQKVKGYISKYGGTQVAINKVEFNGGSVLFATPGSDAREVANASAGTTVESSAWTTCPLGDFCQWNGWYYGGNTKHTYYRCGVLYTDPFTGLGSWKNDQTPQDGTGPRVQMYNGNKVFIYATPPPWSTDKTGDWGPVGYFRICG